MAHDLVFYTNPMSRGRIVRWMLEEVGAPYTTRLIDYGPAMKTPEYLAINRMGKVPAIRHGDTIVTECAAICAYLADAFPEADLAPPPGERGAYYRWLFFVAGPYEAATLNRSFGFELDEKQQAQSGYGTFEAVLDTLENAVAVDGYIAGDNFSAADVYVGSHIYWGLEYDLIDKRPAFVDYWTRVSDRDAHRRATELDDAAMPADTA